MSMRRRLLCGTCLLILSFALTGCGRSVTAPGDVGADATIPALAANAAGDFVGAVNNAPALVVRTSPRARDGFPHPVIAGPPPLDVKINMCPSRDPDPEDSLRFDVSWGDGTETGPDDPGAGTAIEDGGPFTGCNGRDCCRHRHRFDTPGRYVAEASVSDKHLEDQAVEVRETARSIQKLTIIVGRDDGDDRPPPPPPPPCDGGPCTVFVTSTGQRSGNYGGVAGADAICQSLAGAAGLAGTYLAWLSDSTGTSPDTRFSRPTEPYVRVDGVQFAASYSALTTSGPTAPLNVTELNQTLQLFNGTWVRTGTRDDGTPSLFNPNHCDDWTSDSASLRGLSGEARASTYRWTGELSSGGQTSWLNPICSASVFARLYCFQQ